jgi:hypothetical protein
MPGFGLRLIYFQARLPISIQGRFWKCKFCHTSTGPIYLSAHLQNFSNAVMPLIALIIFSALLCMFGASWSVSPFFRHPGARSNLFLELGLDYRNIKINMSQGFSDVLLILSNCARWSKVLGL